MSIRWKLILLIGIPLLELSLGMVLLHYVASRNAAIQNTQTHLQELVSRYRAEYENELSGAAQIGQGLAQLLSSRSDLFDQGQVYHLLTAQIQRHEGIQGITVAFEPGVYPNAGGSPGSAGGSERFAPYVRRDRKDREHLIQDLDYTDYTRQRWYTAPAERRQPLWSHPYRSGPTDQPWLVAYLVPFFQGEQLLGVVSVELNLQRLNRRVGMWKVRDGYCMVLSQEGRFLVHPDQALVLRQDIFGLAEIRHQPELANLGRAMTAGRNGTVKIEDFATGQSQWVVYAPLPRVGWSIAATVNEPAVLAPVHAAIRRDIAILFLGSIPVVLVVMVMALRITRPIKELAQTVRQIAAGNLNLQPPKFKSRDEIGEFANAFGMMVSELRRHVDELTKETANREAVESELRVGRSIQAALLPSEFPPYPDRPEIDLYALNKPAKQVAGDFFDFFFVDEETLAVVIADVSGKGVPAALMMAVTRTLLRSLEIQKLSPAQAMERINRAILRESAANMFVTLFLGYYNTRSGEIRYVNAGHNPPYKLTTQGKAVSLGPSTAPLLGVFEDEPFEEGLCRLEPGEYLLLYTDGLTEARSPEPEDQMLGDVRFQRLIEHAQPRNAEHLCLSLLEILERFQGYALHDDMTLVALRRCVVPALEPPGNGQAEALGDEPADVETEETSEAEAEPDSGLLHEQAAATSALHGHNSAGSY